jgi:predicted enzyme related to lactoylglutathione lyase
LLDVLGAIGPASDEQHHDHARGHGPGVLDAVRSVGGVERRGLLGESRAVLVVEDERDFALEDVEQLATALGMNIAFVGVTGLVATDAERDRAFFREVLEFPSVDAGGGWLIFALPPAELAAHPAEEGGQHELYLMCDDVHTTVADLKAKGVDVARPVSDEGFGPVTAIRLPGGGELGLYQPTHPSPLSSV